MVNVEGGVTVAVLDCLRNGEWWTVIEMVNEIAGSGRTTSPQEVAGVMLVLTKSDVGNMLEVDKAGRSFRYRMVEPYTKASAEELHWCYLKRMKEFDHGVLLEKYGPAPGGDGYGPVPKGRDGSELELGSGEEPKAPVAGAEVGVYQGPEKIQRVENTPRVILVEVDAGEVVTIIVRGKSL